MHWRPSPAGLPRAAGRADRHWLDDDGHHPADGRQCRFRLGRTDSERLQFGELVYTGVRRTPVCALLGAVVAAELFATMHDAYLLSGMIPEDAGRTGSRPTGGPRRGEYAHARLARMLGGDARDHPEAETLELAQTEYSRVQRRWSRRDSDASPVVWSARRERCWCRVRGSFLLAAAVDDAIEDVASVMSLDRANWVRKFHRRRVRLCAGGARRGGWPMNPRWSPRLAEVCSICPILRERLRTGSDRWRYRADLCSRRRARRGRDSTARRDSSTGRGSAHIGWRCGC